MSRLRMWRRRHTGHAWRFGKTHLDLEVLEDRTLFSTNPIVTENALPGNPVSEWTIGSGAGDASLQGFGTDISVNRGQTVSFKINDTALAAYHVDIYRMGYYQGNGARRVATIGSTSTLRQNQPNGLTDPTGLLDCGNWSVSASWPVPANATSGIYFARLAREDTGGASDIFFIVRDDTSTSDLLFQTSDSSWQAYNNYGGNSLYVGSHAGGGAIETGRAYKVSYNRPFNTRNIDPETWVFNAEYPMVRFLEANGYDVSYFTDVDSDRLGGLIRNHKVFLSVGHDEYWSGPQRANVQAARDAGVNLAFFSGNEIFEKTRWESSIDGSGTPYRTLVCYKETFNDAKIDPTPTWTGTWRDPRFSPPADGGRPENALSGTLYVANGSGSITVPAANGQTRFWRNTSIATLPPGTSATLPPGTLGFEFDQPLDNGFQPAGLFTLSSTVVATSEMLLDYGYTLGSGTPTHSMTEYRAASGALVFSASTIQWSWGLDGNHDGGTTTPDVRMQQATVNLLADMGSQPGTLQPSLIAASASTDTIPPMSTITSPVGGANVQTGGPVTITGTASDSGGGVVAGVEVSVDGGATWHPATGGTSWSYTWWPSTPGAATIRSRAVDDSGNLENPSAGLTVHVVAPATGFSIWTGAATPRLFKGNGQPVELGLKFRSDVPGTVTGVRFYKASTDTGSHLGNLWDGSGKLLATATFTNETASGWQQMLFSSPVTIAANATYVVSYHTASGYFGDDQYYFVQNYVTSGGVDNGVLHAPSDAAAGGNGVYYFGASAFPNASYVASNYWVDVLFNGTGTTTSLTASSNPSAVGQAVTFTATVHAAGTPTGAVTFKDGTAAVGTGTLNAFGQATFTTSSMTAGSHTITAVYGGDTTFSGSTSASLTLTVFVSSTSTSTAVAASANLLLVGQAVTFTATVTAIGTPTGTVTFKDGPTTLGNAALNASGQASFTTTALAAGSHSITAVYGGDATFSGSSSAPLTVTVALSLWSSTAAPASIAGNGQAVELGLKFRSDNPGMVMGVRFYKASASTGTHLGDLWDANGNLLATATFSNETASGWQQVLFSSPLAIASNTTYVVSYHADVGYFGYNQNYFANGGVDSGVLHAPSDAAAGGNGVYRYGASALPNASYAASNYWVDVLFNPTGTTATSTVVVSSANPAAFGQNVTYTATVASGAGTPTGTVTFNDGTTILGNATLNASGQATFSTPSLAVGSHAITAVYGGSSSYASSTSATLTQAVNKDGTTTALSSSANPAAYGQGVTFTAAVSATAPGASTPSGTVTFSIDGTAQAPVVLSGGIATLSISSLSVGSHNVSAAYGGDGNFTGSTSATLAQAVNPSATTTVLTSSANPSGVGQAVTFTATVSPVAPGAGTPGGQVTFKDGATTLGTVTLNGSGQATFTISSLAQGSHAITANYNGSTSFTASTSLTLTQTVNNPTTTTIASSGSPSFFGQAVTFTATVTSGAGTPTGTVTFNDGATILGNAPLNASGQATFTTPSLAVGSHTITAVYGGSSSYASSTSPALTQAVNKDGTSTALSSSSNPAVYGQSVTFTATVSAAAPGAGTLSGTVTFTIDGTAQAPVALNGGSATLSTSGLGVGSHNVTAAYNGDGNFTGSTSATLAQAVNPSATTTALTSSANPSGVGQAVTFTATVSPVAPGAGTPGGPVTFKDGTTTLGTVTLNASGQATFTISSLAQGSHVITASYSGSTNFTTSTSPTLTQTVNQAVVSTTTMVTSSINPSVVGQAVTFTATVTAGAGTPTGRVTFKDGGDTVATGTLNASGQATFTTVNLVAGNHFITAVYGGDATFLGSSSAPLTVVTAFASLWSNAATPAGTAGNGQSVELGLKFRSDIAGRVAGVRFYKANASTGTHLGDLWDAAGNLLASATFTNETASGWQQVLFSSPVAIGANTTYVVSYHTDVGYFGYNQNYFTNAVDSGVLHAPSDAAAGGNGVYRLGASAFPNATYSASNYWVDVLLDAPGTTTTEAASPNPSVLGQAVTFTATVSGAGTPSGSVTFKDGATTLGIGTLNAAGQAAFTTTALAAGTHSITAVYGGDGTFPASTSPVLNVAVLASATSTITTVAASANLSVVGQAVTFTATVNAQSTPTGNVTFEDGTTILGTGMLNGSGQATFTTAGLTAGSHSITAVYGGDATFSGSTSASLTVGTVLASLWGSAALPGGSAGNGQSVELGLKFRSDIAGRVAGVRFYKVSASTGTHLGDLWDASGNLLATATFTNETASGWQQVLFASPVTIAANTTYIVSYHADVGYFGYDQNYFAAGGVDSGVLHALSDAAAGGNGVYRYGGSAFPNATYSASNYWVDVLLDGSGGGGTASFDPPAVSVNTDLYIQDSAVFLQQISVNPAPSTGPAGAPAELIRIVVGGQVNLVPIDNHRAAVDGFFLRLRKELVAENRTDMLSQARTSFSVNDDWQAVS